MPSIMHVRLLQPLQRAWLSQPMALARGELPILPSFLLAHHDRRGRRSPQYQLVQRHVNIAPYYEYVHGSPATTATAATTSPGPSATAESAATGASRRADDGRGDRSREVLQVAGELGGDEE